MVAHFVKFLGYFEYTATQGAEHVWLYAMADKYDVPQLKVVSSHHFKSFVAEFTSLQSLLSNPAVSLVYGDGRDTSVLFSDTDLQEYMAEKIVSLDVQLENTPEEYNEASDELLWFGYHVLNATRGYYRTLTFDVTRSKTIIKCRSCGKVSRIFNSYCTGCEYGQSVDIVAST